MKTELLTTTDGQGLWSSRPTQIRIVEVYINYLDDEKPVSFGELHVKWNPEDWDVDRDGLIYTDDGWERTFQEALQGLGLSEAAAKAVGYSEAGMQGDDYVSLDVGPAFFRSRCKTVKELMAEFKAK